MILLVVITALAFGDSMVINTRHSTAPALHSDRFIVGCGVLRDFKKWIPGIAGFETSVGGPLNSTPNLD